MKKIALILAAATIVLAGCAKNEMAQQPTAQDTATTSATAVHDYKGEK